MIVGGGSRLTLMEAISAGVIDPAGATGTQYVDRRTGERMTIEDAERRGLIEQGFSSKLLTPTGQ